MTKIFISYRREDSADICGRIYDWLIRSFDQTDIFKDVDSISYGVDFLKSIKSALAISDVMLIIIGPRWLGSSEAYTNRLLDPRDFVRIEIEEALRQRIPILPVFVYGATMPSHDAVPETLSSIILRNALRVRPDPDFPHDIQRLVKAIEQLVMMPRPLPIPEPTPPITEISPPIGQASPDNITSLQKDEADHTDESVESLQVAVIPDLPVSSSKGKSRHRLQILLASASALTIAVLFAAIFLLTSMSNATNLIHIHATATTLAQTNVTKTVEAQSTAEAAYQIANSTADVQAQATANANATAAVTEQYIAQAPGNCDTGNATWSISAPTPTCSANGMTMVLPTTSTYSSTVTFTWNNHHFPYNYTAEVDISQLNNTCASELLRETTAGNYSFQICYNGVWTIYSYAYANENSQVLLQGHVATASKYHLKASVSEAKLSLSVNGGTTNTIQNALYKDTASIALSVDTAGSATFSNFHYTPMP